MASASPFVRRPIVVQRLPDRELRLLGREFAVQRPDGSETTVELAEDEYAGVLAELFDLVLPEGEVARLVASVPAVDAVGEVQPVDTDALRLVVVVGSVRPGRIGDRVAYWFSTVVQADDWFATELVDLAELDLPVSLRWRGRAGVRRAERRDGA